MFAANDGGHEVTSEGRTCHHQVAVFVDVEAGAVGCKAGLHTCRETRTQVAAYGGGAEEHYRRFLGFDYLVDGLRIRLGNVCFEFRLVDDKHFVGTVGDTKLGLVGEFISGHYGHNLFAEGVGEFAGLSQQLEGNVLHLAVSLLYEYVNVFEI